MRFCARPSGSARRAATSAMPCAASRMSWARRIITGEGPEQDERGERDDGDQQHQRLVEHGASGEFFQNFRADQQVAQHQPAGDPQKRQAERPPSRCPTRERRFRFCSTRRDSRTVSSFAGANDTPADRPDAIRATTPA